MNLTWGPFRDLYYDHTEANSQRWFDLMEPEILKKLKSFSNNYCIDPIEMGQNEAREVFEKLKVAEFKRFDKAPALTFSRCTKNMLSYYRYDSFNLKKIVNRQLKASPFASKQKNISLDAVIWHKSVSRFADFSGSGFSNAEISQMEDSFLDKLENHIKIYLLGEKNSGTPRHEKLFLYACIIGKLSIADALNLLTEEDLQKKSKRQWERLVRKRREVLALKIDEKIIPEFLRDHNLPLVAISKEDILRFLGQKKFRKKS